MKTISWTREKLEQFKHAYEAAKASYEKATPQETVVTHPDGNDIFVFEDNEFVIAYAKYLIEYLEPRLIK